MAERNVSWRIFLHHGGMDCPHSEFWIESGQIKPGGNATPEQQATAQRYMQQIQTQQQATPGVPPTAPVQQPQVQAVAQQPAQTTQAVTETPEQIAQMAAGVLPNPKGYTIGDALRAAVANEQQVAPQQAAQQPAPAASPVRANVMVGPQGIPIYVADDYETLLKMQSAGYRLRDVQMIDPSSQQILNPANFPAGIDVNVAVNEFLAGRPMGGTPQAPVVQQPTVTTSSPSSVGTVTQGTLQPDPLTTALQGNQPTPQPQIEDPPVDEGSGTPTGGPTSPPPAEGYPVVPGQMYVRMPDGSERTFYGITEQLNQALQQGGRPIMPNGELAQVEQFQGGWLLNGNQPLNVWMGEGYTPEQIDVLTQAGRLQPTGPESLGPGTGQPTVPPANGTTTTGAPVTPGSPAVPPGYLGNQGANAPSVPSDLQDMLRQLIQEARNQGVRGQEALTGVTDDLKNYLAFSRAAAEQSMGRRDSLVDALTGMVTPGIASAMGTMNQATGLSPEAMAALRAQAVDGTQRQYQGQVQDLKTQLAARGAMGGMTPGAADQMIQGYAPLMANRDATRSNLLSQAILADEQRKFDTLGLNRQTAASFANLGGSLAAGLGNVYNPSQFLGGNEAALSGLLGAANSGTAAGLGGLNAAANFTGNLADLAPGSFRNTLYGALLGTGLGTLGDWLRGQIGGQQQGGGTNFNVNLGLGGNNGRS